MDELLHLALEGHRQRAFALVREERIVQAHRVEEFIFADLQLVQLRSFLEVLQQQALLLLGLQLEAPSQRLARKAAARLLPLRVQHHPS